MINSKSRNQAFTAMSFGDRLSRCFNSDRSWGISLYIMKHMAVIQVFTFARKIYARHAFG